MTNQEIAAAFEQVADLLEFQGANPFRVRAYRNGARKIVDLGERVSEIVADESRQLTDLDGIGKDLAEKIEQLVTTGRLTQLEELQSQVPGTVLAMLRVPGLGPKKAAVLFKELGVESLDQLRAACDQQQVRDLKGFGAKTEEAILKGLAIAEQGDQRTKWAKADEIVTEVLEHLRSEKSIKRVEPAGSYRRGCETVGDLDFLVEATDAVKVMDHFGNYPGIVEVIARGDTKMSVRLASGMQMDLRVVPKESFGAASQYFTGSKAHNVELRGRAKQRGLKINEWGVFQVETDGTETYLAGRTEKDVYKTMDLPCFPPEIREDREEFQWAEAGKLPKLLEQKDIRADLHMHTNATDGKATLEEMIAAAKERGLEYIAITDHSQRVSMANGLDAKRALAQWKEIDKLQKKHDDIRILKGIECDILEKGGMDLPDDVLAQADWVIASVHYGQNQPSEQITERILGALENPHVDIIAHPTGRLINRREPYAVDMDQVFNAAVKHKKMLELNANPARLDLHDQHCAAARRLGIPIVISTDAHSTGGLDVMRYGVLQARRGGLTAKDVANTLPWEKFAKLLN
ncbi:DNA polymerase/3'-5' exonuclease PolX [Bythopirellula goksoeyrii]|uniref:DNA polymerase beta n=1 Tax=Bythopirellula goksoeyrii TaxID=1400387 RepID=A0A5B9Q966_9BACT|nr:DNA polymerase/3'-5' exonuclease PolX [Bythopirellula goksoeyrii]QEG35478.1 DNA polymerase/3'-5' exonuclease PolX [Bythopirellula goksoeyrii]